MKSLKDRRVLIAGLGKSGEAAARFCAERGARVIAVDSKVAHELGDVVSRLEPLGVEFRLGSDGSDFDCAVDMVIASPGVPLEHPLLLAARGKGVPVIGEMELAVREITKPIIAVTGTNGKTTTTSLIGHLIDRSGFRACVAGNIGEPIIGQLDCANDSDFVILEVSSFQLDTTPSLKAWIGVWLNATEDHIDRHRSFESYVASKAKLFRQMNSESIGIYNARDDVVSKSVEGSPASLVPFDAEGPGLSLDEGNRAWYDAGTLYIGTRSKGICEFPLSEAKLLGAHNRENMLAALMAATLAGCAYGDLRKGFADFEGLPHRMEFVGEHSGVSYFDDSKGTNVGATAKALDGFAEPVVLIAGGIAKGSDLSALVPKVSEKVKRAILIGEAAEEMGRLFSTVTATEYAGTMEDAVKAAAKYAEPGDVVLLSPACASFDMFRDYKDRGNAFKQAVNKLVTGH